MRTFLDTVELDRKRHSPLVKAVFCAVAVSLSLPLTGLSKVALTQKDVGLTRSKHSQALTTRAVSEITDAQLIAEIGPFFRHKDDSSPAKENGKTLASYLILPVMPHLKVNLRIRNQ